MLIPQNMIILNFRLLIFSFQIVLYILHSTLVIYIDTVYRRNRERLQQPVPVGFQCREMVKMQYIHLVPKTN